uniref:interferon-inducible GTPase 1-like n=1 Tax=Myodes glareolus TaxID=447135 RepID=UPI0020221621|nr:interferon-inducible GTPase 1-like [Myodes glareolus]
MGQSFSSTDRGDLESSFTAYFNNIEIENKIIPPGIIHLIKRSLKKGDVLEAHHSISGGLECIYYAPINVAVTGESGAGKSSFINALRGVRPEEEDATHVGIAETAMRTPYKHPKIETLTFWNLPGIGTMNIPPKYYLEKVKFQEYDFFVILSSTRFKLLELDLAQAIRLKRKMCYFVKTKVDADLRNEKESKPGTFDRVKTLQQVRRHCVNTFVQNNMDAPPIFLISNHNLSDYDFPVLMDTLVKDLPAQKRHNFILSLPTNTVAVADRKHKSLQQCILLEACQAGILATLPAVDILMDGVEELKVKLNHYRVLFGLDDDSLEVMANDSQVPVEQLTKNINSPYLLETKKEETLGEMFLKYVEKFASANGGPLATGLYFGKTFYLQLYFLDTVTEDAKVLLRETYFKKLVQAQLIHSE